MKNRGTKKYQDDFYASVMALTETCRGFSLILMVIDHPSFRLSAPALDSLAWFYLEALTFFSLVGTDLRRSFQMGEEFITQMDRGSLSI